MIYICFEHIEIGLEDFVDEYETHPTVDEHYENNACAYCENEAKYVIK